MTAPSRARCDGLKRNRAAHSDTAQSRAARRAEKARRQRPTVPTCRSCGCTDTCACPGGCWWVEPDLCSACSAEEID